ncbi:MAG: hypothetical protein ACLT9P_06025 [Evtepia gabavorous]
MSFAGSFQAIAARYGQTVTLWRDGEIVGTGRAVLRPLLGEARQFVPTDLGPAPAGNGAVPGRGKSSAGGTTGRLGFAAGERFYGVRNERRWEAGRSGSIGGPFWSGRREM